MNTKNVLKLGSTIGLILSAGIANAANGISSLETNASGQFQTILNLILIGAFIGGIVFLAYAFLDMSKKGGQQGSQIPAGQIIFKFVAGIALCGISTILYLGQGTLFGDENNKASTMNVGTNTGFKGLKSK